MDTIHLSDVEDEYKLHGTHTLGQTFTCHHAGLEGIGVWMTARSGGEVVLHLRESADDVYDIAVARASLPPGGGAAFYYFAIPRQQDVNGKTLFLLLESPETDEAGSPLVPYRTDPAPSVGMLYLDGRTTPGHISLQLHYNVLSILEDVSRQAIEQGRHALWLLTLALLVCILPGVAAVAWLLRDADWLERLAMAAGVGVAINALLMYTTMSGLRLGKAASFVYLSLCGALLVWKWCVGRSSRQARLPGWREMRQWLRSDPAPALLMVVFLVSLGVRLLAVRGLVAPMWGDSYQHSMIAQLLVDNGGLFDSWAPYAPLTTFTYHFGFHANVALFHWLSGDPILQSVILVGQVLNALAVLAVYPLAVRVAGGNRLAGVGAVLGAGLLSPMPMYYVNWGRYTQLSGQVILPVLAWLTLRVAEEERTDWRAIVLTAITAAGLGVTHYRVVLLYGAFVAAWGVVFLLRSWQRWQVIATAVLRLSAIGIATIVLFAPWWWHVSGSPVARMGTRLLNVHNWDWARQELLDALRNWPLFTPALLTGAGALGLAVCAFRRRAAGAVIALWGIGMLLLANPYLVGLPGAGIINNLTAFIALYIPLSILAGAALGEAATAWHRGWWGRMLLAMLVLLASGWGATHRIRDVDYGFAMVTPADMAAMAWIRENTPTDALFLVNEFSAYRGTAVVGADAGWWIPLLTNRRNTVPPLNYWMERTSEPGLHRRLREDLAYLRQVSPTSEDGVRFLRRRGVTHVYVGQKNGTVGNPGPPLLDVEKLRQSDHYTLVYRKDGVWVFALNDSTGQVDPGG